MLAVRDRLIVALDVATAAEARHIISALGDSVSTFKVGKQLFTAEGPTLVREIVAGGHKVFLDLKFHDIPTPFLRLSRLLARWARACSPYTPAAVRP